MPRVHWLGLDRQVPGHEDDDEDNNLHNERLGNIESIVIDDEESEVRQEVEGNNLVVNAIDCIEIMRAPRKSARSGLFAEHYKAKMYDFLSFCTY